MHKTPCLLLGGLLAVSASAADKKPEAPATHKVKAAPFTIEVKLNGVFAAKNAHEVRLKTKSWADLKVLEAVPHGASVKKGDMLVQLDPEKLDQKIHDSGLDLELSRLDLGLAKVGLEYAEATIPMDLAGVERAYHQVKEDLDRYLKVQKLYNIKSAERSLTSSKNFLAYAEEELKQLKKMYAADDITEETEEIILFRAADSVARARHSLAGAMIRKETSLKISIPREGVTKKEGELRKRLELVKARSSSEADLKKKRLGLEKQQIAHTRAKEAHEKLVADRKLLKVRAPAGGIVYYGSFNKGVWGGQKLIAPKLKKDGKLTPGSVFMTVVEPRPLQVYALLDEKDLRHVKAGMKGEATAKVDPDNDLAVTIASVSRVPVETGKFEVVLNANPGDGPLVPGMSCSVKLVAYENAKALAVPAKAVFEDGDAKVVYLKGGKKKAVTTGKSAGGKTEILKGLKAGDEVLLEKPKK
jgi:HlyD family secretion protein